MRELTKWSHSLIQDPLAIVFIGQASYAVIESSIAGGTVVADLLGLLETLAVLNGIMPPIRSLNKGPML